MQHPISDCAYPIQLGGCICGSEYCPLKLFTRSVGFFLRRMRWGTSPLPLLLPGA